MINGVHFMLYSKDAEADRDFLRDVLGFQSVDAGRGWLIFALPAGEIAVHPAVDGGIAANAEDGVVGAAVYLMCDDLEATIEQLRSRKVKFTPVETARWGILTTFLLPSGAKVGLYQPTHPTALNLR